MRILGIDPGLATMGYGVIEYDRSRYRLIQFGALITQPRQPMPVRLRAIYTGMQQLMETFTPDDVAFEELFFAKNVTTGIAVASARGTALAAAAAYTEAIYEYTPMQIKQAVTGYGKADKRQVQEMVRLLLHMESIARPDDAADALAICVTHANSAHAKSLFRMQ